MDKDRVIQWLKEFVSFRAFIKNGHWVLLIIPFVIYYHFGWTHLTNFQTADESLWFPHSRIAQYWEAIEKKDWKRTRINDKPGIMLAYVSGLGLNFDPTTEKAQPDQDQRGYIHFNPELTESVNFVYRYPLFLINGLLAFYIFWVIKHMTGSPWPALFSGTLILLSPILLGISQIVNPDSLFWSFSAAALFTYLAFLKTGRGSQMFLAGLFLGFTLASKYVGVIFLPFFFFSLIAFLWYEVPRWQESEVPIRKKIAWRSIGYLVVMGLGLLVFALLMPAVFVNAKYFYKGTIGFKGMEPIFWSCVGISVALILDAAIFKSFLARMAFGKTKYLRITVEKLLFVGLIALFAFTVYHWMHDLKLVDPNNQFPFDARKSGEFAQLPLYQQFVLEARAVSFSLTPVVVILLLGGWLLSLVKMKRETDSIIFTLSAFIPIFIYAVIQQKLLVHIRYSVILQPIMITLAALALFELFQWGKLIKTPKIILAILLVVVSIPALRKIEPFYFNYANELLPQEKTITNGWGYGGYEAAQYLNGLPEASSLKVVADYYGTCLFADTRCVMYSDKVRNKAKVEWYRGELDYFVISSKGFSRYKLNESMPQLENMEPVWQLNIDGRPGNYVRVVKNPYQ